MPILDFIYDIELKIVERAKKSKGIKKYLYYILLGHFQAMVVGCWSVGIVIVLLGVLVKIGLIKVEEKE